MDITLNNYKINMDRVNRLQTYLYEEMKNMDDNDRDLPIIWNVIHMSSATQLAKILAFKRGIDPELAAITATLHDVGTIYTKKSKDHAKNAEPYIREIIAKYNNDLRKELTPISIEEEKEIIAAVIDHSNKGNITDNKLSELLKDVDSFDRMLYGIDTNHNHLIRAQNYSKEINVNVTLNNQCVKIDH